MEQEPQINFAKPMLDLFLAKSCVRYSSDAYDAPADASDIYDSETDTRIIIRETLTCIFVAFRGTKSLRNFLTDAKFLRKNLVSDGSSGEVHAGFLQAHQAIIFRLMAAIAVRQRYAARPKWIVLTGHSLGGALAVLSGCSLFGKAKELGWPLPKVITFGQPRVGNKKFATYCHQLFGDHHFRFEHEADLVTRIPGFGFIGYRHSGHSAFMRASGGYVVDPLLIVRAFSDVWELWKLRNKGAAALALAITMILDDHHTPLYLEGVNALC